MDTWAKDIERIDLRHDALMHRLDERHSFSWKAHENIHAMAIEAIRIQAASLEKRMDAANEWRATLGDRDMRFATQEALDSLVTRLDRNELDTRLRFESMVQLAREEGRAGQDLKVGSGAIVASIIAAIALLGVVVAVANYATSH